MVGDAVQPRTVYGQRCVSIGRLDAGAHAFQRLDDAPHRAARQRGVANQPARKAVARHDAGHEPHRRARVSGVERLGRREQAANTAALDENPRPADTSRGVLGHFDAQSLADTTGSTGSRRLAQNWSAPCARGQARPAARSGAKSTCRRARAGGPGSRRAGEMVTTTEGGM